MTNDLQPINKSGLPVATMEAMRDYARQSKSASTWRNYRTQYRQFENWCASRGCAARPAEPVDVAAYVTERAQAGAAVASINVTLAAIANAHQMAGQSFDRKHPTISVVVQGIRRAHAQPQTQAAPITGKFLGQILNTCGANPKDLRDAALLALMYVLALRVSEVAGLDWAEQGKGSGWLTISGVTAELTLIRSKGSQVRSKGSQADPVTVVIPRAENPRAMKAIEDWVRFAEIEPGEPLMRGLTRGGNVRAARMHPTSLGTVIKARIVLHLMALGAPRDKAEAEAAKYSGHSGRVGFYVAASEAGAPPQHIAAIARHKTLNMARRYSEKADMLKNAPHRLPGVGV